MLRSFVASMLALSSLAVVAAEARDDQAIRNALTLMYPGIQIESIHPAPWAGWYEVATPTELVYASADASLVFAGRVYDARTKENLTSKRWNELHSIDFDELPFELALKSVKGDGSRRLAVFADPDCPFCRKLEQAMKDVTNVTIYTFLFPLEDLHPDARARAKKIWCSKDRAAAWTDWIVDHVEPQNLTCADDPTQRLLQLGKKLKVNSTPTIFLADGRPVFGALTREQLEKVLDAAATSATLASKR